jgi:hypothetical protein
MHLKLCMYEHFDLITNPFKYKCETFQIVICHTLIVMKSFVGKRTFVTTNLNDYINSIFHKLHKFLVETYWVNIIL